MSYLTEAFLPHLRLTLLRLLAEAPGYCANSSVLTNAARQLGVVATRDQARVELAWLAEQRLVTTLEPTAGLIVATLTERGHDVATGAAEVPGVQRPTPGA